MREMLQSRMIDFLVNDIDAETYLLKNNKEFADPKMDSNRRAEILVPYIQTNLMINECVNLEFSLSSGNIQLKTATSSARKDRFSSLSYGNYFASLLDQELVREEDTSSDFEIMSGLFQMY